MKRITKYTALFLAGSLAVMTACGPKMNEVDVRHTPSVNAARLTPLTDESGSVRAYIGTEISAEGFNLDRVSRVDMGETAAEITEQTIKTLKFRIPALQLAQQDAPHVVQLTVYDADGQTPIFNYPYYVTVPVTDALITGYAPAEGTVGTEITLTGRNLEQLTRVHFGDATVEASAFTSAEAEAVKFLVPAGRYAAGNSEIAISAEWGTASIDVTDETPFAMHTPRFDAVTQPEGTHAAIGEEVTFTGENIDLVESVMWGDNELIILEKEAASITVKFPSSIDAADPAVVTAALTALWGVPAQVTTVASAYRVDTTPVGPATPVLIRLEAEDGGADNRLYLGKTVTVTGENMASVEGFTVGGVAAALVGAPTDVEARFIVPDGVDFDEATEVELVALYNGGNPADFGKVTVCPFYYFKGVRLGLGSNSKSTYTEYAAANAFFYPDLNRVVSTDAWYDEALDPYAKSGSNKAIASASKLNKAAITAEEYYAVKPYVFFITNSSSKLSLAGCANSASQIKTHCRFIDGEAKSLPSAFGTPIMQYRVVTGEAADPIRSGTLTSMNYDGSTMPGSGAPSLGKAETTSVWVKGSVLVMSYSNYDKGEKPAAVSDFARTGYIVIRDVTCADLSTGLANADRDGYIEFDMYWSKMQNR